MFFLQKNRKCNIILAPWGPRGTGDPGVALGDTGRASGGPGGPGGGGPGGDPPAGGYMSKISLYRRERTNLNNLNMCKHV